MKAQLLQTYGDTPDFRLADTDVPAVKPGHVLVRVAATSVNPIDIKIRKMKPVFAPALPAILGMDVAGTVEAVGEGVSGFRPGDEVFGCAGGLADMPGALAEYMLADARLMALKPANLTMAQAAALPLVTITAWDALFDRARIKAGQFVLIHAGTGGVGHVAVQLAKSCGARVAATVSSATKGELARSLGADEIINYREEKPEEYVARLTGRRGFDVVFDTVGGTNLDASFWRPGRAGWSSPPTPAPPTTCPPARQGPDSVGGLHASATHHRPGPRTPRRDHGSGRRPCPRRQAQAASGQDFFPGGHRKGP